MEQHLHRPPCLPCHRADLLSSSQHARAAVAALVNATPEEMAFVQNTATGISMIAHGLPLRAGDEVLLTDMEYPANVYPWMSLQEKGVRLRILPNRGGGLDVDMLRAAVNDRTRAVSVSSVQFLSGYRADLQALGALCHERHIYFVVDAIQSLGVIPMDVRAYHVDCLASGGWKWLLGPLGQALLFCRRELIPEMRTILSGAEGVVNTGNYLQYDPRPVDSADRFQVGAENAVGIVGLGEAVQMLLDLGVTRIELRLLELTQYLIEELQERGYALFSSLDPARRSGIVTFSAPDVDALYARLSAANVVVACRADASGKKYIRVSPHAYNTTEDIDRLLDVLRS
jgi:selenocysteine lyase/cysteine desulfurase